MKNRRLRSAQKKGDHGGQNSTDFISKMPEDVLVMILSLMPIKDAAVTSSLSTRWRHLWRNLIRLNFDGTEIMEEMTDDELFCDLVRDKFINQVYSVISSYNLPKVQEFRIRFDLFESYYKDIDEWIRFALDKKVERLTLDFLEQNHCILDPIYNYEFMLPSANAMVVEMLSLKEIFLMGVNLNEPTLNEILKNSPHLEKLYMYGSGLFPHIHVGGKDINLKHLELVLCFGLESISLYGFDLVTFAYSGTQIELHLTDLPKLTELDVGEVSVGLENNVFSQISSCASNLQVLALDMSSPKIGLDVNAIPKIPNVKKLRLTTRAEGDDCLLEVTSIAQACPSLEAFSISLHWFSPMKRRRKVRHVATPQVHEHLKLFKVTGYYGRISDLELVVYVIDNAVSLKKIIIDPSCDAFSGDSSILKKKPAARSSAKRQLTPLLPPGVDLAIL